MKYHHVYYIYTCSHPSWWFQPPEQYDTHHDIADHDQIVS